MRHKIIKLYKKAEKQGFAIGAFNFSTNEIIKGIVFAARKLRAPIIISTSEGERGFFGLEESVAVYNAVKKKYPHVILHADHTKSFQEIKRIIDAGYPSVHFDGSELSFRHNIRETKRAVEYAHNNNVFIEGELGGITGGSTTHKEKLSDVLKKNILTDPDQAQEFVKLTDVDSLAVSIGNAHGIWKDKPKLDFERLKEIKKITGKFLVLHGGSGIPAKDLRKAIKIGIDKINLNTELRVAYAQALFKGLHHREDYVPYHYMKDVVKAVSKVVEEHIILFKADKKV
ncbi:class II fructose-bisphosphate aldolase [Candidatus Woesearchaeota archaeon]|nr:class II fructose-bisphosphate aldolase [Candidatus Woesearchaeota archaeon]